MIITGRTTGSGVRVQHRQTKIKIKGFDFRARFLAECAASERRENLIRRGIIVPANTGEALHNDRHSAV